MGISCYVECFEMLTFLQEGKHLLMVFYNAASVSLSGSNLNDVLVTDFN